MYPQRYSVVWLTFFLYIVVLVWVFFFFFFFGVCGWVGFVWGFFWGGEGGRGAAKKEKPAVSQFKIIFFGFLSLHEWRAVL